MSEKSSLIVDVRPGERLSISSGEDVSVELVKKSGQLARLRVVASKDVKIEKKTVEQHVASMA
jgi:sRNA-binding carbon storage regulator CsrA